MKITAGTVAQLIYTLRYEDAEGEIIEEITEENPMDVLIGHEVLLEVFEKNIIGLSAGDSFKFTLQPEEAYGDYDEEKFIRVPKVELLEDLPEEAEAEIFEGNVIPITDSDEVSYEAMVVEIKDGIVSLDFNHPLSGEILYFTGKVLQVHTASKKDIEEATKEN